MSGEDTSEKLAIPDGNGSDSRPVTPTFIGSDKVKRRRETLATRILQDPDIQFNVNQLAAEFDVSRRTIQRDLASPEVVAAYDRVVEEFIDASLMQHAWHNIRTDIVQRKSVDRSIWLVEHRAKTAHQERMFEAFQQRLAQEMADSFNMPISSIDFNERIEVEIEPPSFN